MAGQASSARVSRWIFLGQWGALTALCVSGLIPTIASDQATYFALAQSVLAGHGFALHGHPSAFVTPGYPLLLAAVESLAGAWTLRAVQALQALALALTALLAGNVAGELGAGVRRRAAVQLAVGFYPPFVLFAAQALTETVFDLLAMAAIAAAVALYRGRNAAWAAAALALLTAAAVAVRPTGVLIPAAGIGALAVALVSERGLWRKAAVVVLASTLGVGVFCGVWGARNVRALGEFVPFSSEGNLVAYFGNLVAADGMANTGTWQRYVPPETAARIERMGETERNRAFGKLLRSQVESDPAGVALLAVRKVPRLWLNLGFPEAPSRSSLMIALVDAVALLLAGIGSVRVWRHGDPPARAIVGFAVAFVLLLTILHVSTYAVVRYAFSGLVIVFILAAAGLPRAWGTQPRVE